MTFQQIYDAVKPTSPASEWTARDKRRIVSVAKRTSDVVELLEAMMLETADWRGAEQLEIAQKLWPTT